MASSWYTRRPQFLSTLSLRRATRRSASRTPTQANFYPRSPCGERRSKTLSRQSPNRNFYPRSPCGERPRQTSLLLQGSAISIHALLAESDTDDRMMWLWLAISIHALLAESDPHNFEASRGITPISIHALLAESDRLLCLGYRYCHKYFYPRSPCGERLYKLCELDRNNRNFYPRSPCGERLINNVIDGINKIFLSTLSLRRATTHVSTSL